jgi:alkaline phosphatase D
MKALPPLLALALFLLVPAVSTAADDPLGGASRPAPQMTLKREGKQYKRVHQYALRLINHDRLDDADAFLTGWAKKCPQDAETQYMLGVLAARRGQGDQAAACMSRAIDLGLPEGRIVAGPRALLEKVQDHAFFKGLVDKHEFIPVHGPLLGDVSSRSAAVWVRTAKESEVGVVYHETSSPKGGQAIAIAIETTPFVNVSKENDFTAVIRLDGLKPKTGYTYQVCFKKADGRIQRSVEHRFRTFSSPGTPTTFSLAFGGGAGFVPENERMWNTIGSFQPDALLLLGDNVYIDDPESVIMQQYTYQRRQSRPEWRRLTARTPTFTIWDDHDFSTNDSWGGPKIERPFWKRDYAFKIFRDNWANPGYGGGWEQPGCWYSFAIGDVDFVMLDCRYYRTSPRVKTPSMLGPVQLKWLKQELKKAKGTFKVICSSVPWVLKAKGGSKDTWNGYQAEREDIFSFIEQNQIEGIVLMSADRHRSDAWRIQRPNGYDFTEFNSSRLTNQHVHPEMHKQGALISYNKKQSFGLVEFNTATKQPVVKYTVISIDGEKIADISVKRSALVFD